MGKITWSRLEMEELTKLWSDPKKSPSEIAAKMHRSRQAVIAKAHRMDLPCKENWADNGRPWEQPEIDELHRLFAAGMKSNEIGGIMGRSSNGIIGRLQRDGLLKKQKRWTDDEDGIIRLHRADPLSAAKLLPGRTHNAIESRLHDLFQNPSQALLETPVLADADPETAWTPPPKIDWPPQLIGPASHCQFPSWGHKDKRPNPAVFCGAQSFRHSLCEEHFHVCYRTLGQTEL